LGPIRGRMGLTRLPGPINPEFAMQIREQLSAGGVTWASGPDERGEMVFWCLFHSEGTTPDLRVSVLKEGAWYGFPCGRGGSYSALLRMLWDRGVTPVAPATSSTLERAEPVSLLEYIDERQALVHEVAMELRGRRRRAMATRLARRP
jgi:hypothetical protein